MPSPRTLPLCDSGLLHDTRYIVCTSGNVVERLLLRVGQSSTIFHISKNLAYPSQKLGPDVEGNRKRPEIEMTENRKIRRYLNHASKEELECVIVLWSLLSQWSDGLSENLLLRNRIMEFQSRKFNFRTEVCQEQPILPQITVLWIKEVEIAKSTDGST